MSAPHDDPPTIDHAGFLEDQDGLPAYLVPGGGPGGPPPQQASCAFCGVGDSGVIQVRRTSSPRRGEGAEDGEGTIQIEHLGRVRQSRARVRGGDRLEVETDETLDSSGLISGLLEIGGVSRLVAARALESPAGDITRSFLLLSPSISTTESIVRAMVPSGGCVKFKISMGQQRPVFPIHVGPSALDPATGRRRPLSYPEAISSLADLLLAHRPPGARTLVYACGQVDYFTIFAFQEVFRLLGVRNLAGNAEHCLNAGAVHNEILTGQEGPFLTQEQALETPCSFYLLNGWNGFLTHPPFFGQLLKRKGLDAYLVEVAVTESAKVVLSKLGPDRLLLVRSGSDPLLALAVAHEVLSRYPQAIDPRFLERFADADSFERYAALAGSEAFDPERVAARIAAEPSEQERLLRGIRDIAAKIARPEVVPINIPSVGLSQTKGAVAHCLWGSVLGMLGKYGLRADGTPAGGTLRLPGQINAQTEVQGLSSRRFIGRIPATAAGAVEAARRMGLPDRAYDTAIGDPPRAALDYSDPTPPGQRELFLCFGTQFESNMLGRPRWIRKLEAPETTLVVVDPIPDPFTLRTAALVLPSPPHTAAVKLYQNGEWRFSLSVPRKRAPLQTRTDATIVYDVMAEISRRLHEDATLRASCPDLAPLVESGYLRHRFEPPERGGGLPRIDGEVSRPVLWERILAYMQGPDGGPGPLYCRPEHADGRPIAWEELLRDGSLISGGVGTTRYRLDYDDPSHVPFRDLFRQPRRFTFFVPTEEDLRLPEGIVLNSGRSTLSDDRKRIYFALATFNSGKATPGVDMPAENPLHLSLLLWDRLGLRPGDRARVTNVETGATLILPAVSTDRLKGETAYVSFHKSRAELEEGRYLNDVTSHTGRCPYTFQSNFKMTRVRIEPAEADAGQGAETEGHA